MTRQGDIKKEERARKKRNALVYALDHGIVDSLEAQGVELLGFAFRYDAYNCLMTVKAIVGGKHKVAFVGSDSVVNCILKAYRDAERDFLTWGPDKFYPNEV